MIISLDWLSMHFVHYSTLLYSTLLYYTTILYYTILYYTILYYTILLYYTTILYYTILYYTIQVTIVTVHNLCLVVPQLMTCAISHCPSSLFAPPVSSPFTHFFSTPPHCLCMPLVLHCYTRTITLNMVLKNTGHPLAGHLT